MLVLTRKTDQAVNIRDDIIVKILSVDGDKIKIGIEAPKNVRIFRQEIFEVIKKANVEAARNSTQNISAIADMLKQSE